MDEQVFIGFKTSEGVDTALRTLAAERTIATGKQVYKSDIVRESVHLNLAVLSSDRSDIAAILTDLHDGKESFDGAVARLKVLQCQESLEGLGEWINGND